MESVSVRELCACAERAGSVSVESVFVCAGPLVHMCAFDYACVEGGAMTEWDFSSPLVCARVRVRVPVWDSGPGR